MKRIITKSVSLFSLHFVSQDGHQCAQHKNSMTEVIPFKKY
jgi:hypothetical protein